MYSDLLDLTKVSGINRSVSSGGNGIDLIRTFCNQSIDEQELAEFFCLDGRQSHHSWRAWKLGFDAFAFLKIDEAGIYASRDRRDIHTYLSATLCGIEDLRDYYLYENFSEGSNRIASIDGRLLDDAEIYSMERIEFVKLLARPSVAITVPKGLQSAFKEAVAVMVLSVLSKLVVDEKPPSARAVGVYAEARDIWEGVNFLEVANLSSLFSAQSAANARHREHRELKQEALDHYEKNRHRFRSRAAAASEIARLIPIKERTIDKWLKEFNSSG